MNATPPDDRTKRAATWIVGGLVFGAALVGFVIWLGIRLGYVDVVTKLSSGSGEDSSSITLSMP